ncbi:alpha/beta hydrolase family protein [Dyella flava]|uniref:Alpha/beta hydrolase n=1 Tax=Dyella flava TaxID=1920170 RepID=A0ABS2K945_9GAMM|nr:alpha/beta hydrolase [Dyella flava]MBM7127287.1 alpha/beta hydrolase [Dyella flava]GLQ52130.1 dienelactone hydrolase [Dyella flava]
MNLFRCLLAGVLLAGSFPAASFATDTIAPYHVGESGRLFHPDKARDWRGAKTQALLVRIWYPVDRSVTEQPHDIGAPGHPIFEGHPVAADAPLSPGKARYPLLLMSHGTGGSADSLDWLGAALAAQGYIVAAVNHPGNTALEPLTAEGFLLWWERATDVSEVLDGLLHDAVLGPHIDMQRVGAVGFSLGGYTVLELAGARTHRLAFEHFCVSPAADAICHPPEAQGLTHADGFALAPSPQTDASIAHSDDSYRDPRIKAVFAIAPALGEAFNASSFADVRIPIALLAGSADTTVPLGTNAERFARFMPNAKLTLLPGAGHYTFLDVCTPNVGDQPFFCKDGPGVDRTAIHAEAIAQVAAFFAKTLPTTN